MAVATVGLQGMGKYGRVWEYTAAYAQHSPSWRHQSPTHNTAPVGGNILIPSHIFSYTLIPSHKIAAINRLAGLAPQSGGSQPPAAASFHHWAFSSLFRILVMVPVVEKPFTNGIKSISVLFSSNACRSPGSRVSTV